MTLKRILVADDNVEVLEEVRVILENSDYEVETVKSGEEALDLIRGSGRYDLLLTDYVMDKLTGPFLTMAVHDEPAYAGLPVLLMTTNLTESDRKMAGRAGCVDTLDKRRDSPFLDREELVDKVRKYIPR